MLTQKDIQEIENIVDEKITLRTKDLPTRDEFFTKMAEVMGELKKVRESQEAHASDHTRINDRLEKLEEHADISSAL